MVPTLPHNDSDPGRRRAQLEKARQEYTYSYVYPPGIAVAAEVPRSEEFSLSYGLRATWVHLVLWANHVEMHVDELDDGERKAWRQRRIRSLGLALPHRARRDIFAMADRLSRQAPSRQLLDLDDYERFFAVICKTEIARVFDAAETTQDLSFAAQRTAGVNPMVLRGLDAVPDRLPIDAATYARVVAGDTLDAAVAEGRLFLADYALLDGLPTGRWDDGRRPKFLWAPLALFAWRPGTAVARAALVPVAIQCDQKPGPANPIFTPGQGDAWRMAKTIVQMADGNVHQAIMHLGRTHMVMEAVILAAARQLAENHPLHVLLAPHFEFTLALNELATRTLINEGGPIERAFAPTLAAILEAVRDGVQRDYPLREFTPPKDLTARVLDDPARLPEFPYRDDGLLVWRAIERFVCSYVELYYATDADVRRDRELRAFVAELEERDESRGGRLEGVGPIETRADVVELVSLFVWIASAQHSALNFTQFPCQGLAPNMPFAGFGPGPKPDAKRSDLIRLLPPFDLALLQFNKTYTLSNIRANRLADYAHGHFRDPRVAEPLAALRSDLVRAEGAIEARNTNRAFPYPYMLPSGITQSIHT